MDHERMFTKNRAIKKEYECMHDRYHVMQRKQRSWMVPGSPKETSFRRRCSDAGSMGVSDFLSPTWLSHGPSYPPISLLPYMPPFIARNSTTTQKFKLMVKMAPKQFDDCQTETCLSSSLQTLESSPDSNISYVCVYIYVSFDPMRNPHEIPSQILRK